MSDSVEGPLAKATSMSDDKSAAAAMPSGTGSAAASLPAASLAFSSSVEAISSTKASGEAKSRSEAVLLRDATAGDIKAVLEIYRVHVEKTLVSMEFDVPSLEEMEARWSKVTKTLGFPYIVAVDSADRVLGYAYASQFRERKGYQHTCEDTVYLREDACGRGIGKMLLRELISRCRALKLRHMIAGISDAENNKASVGLHASLGFEVIGTFPDICEKFGKVVGVSFLQLDLSKSGDG